MDMAAEQPIVQIDGEAEASIDGMDTVHALLEEYWRAADAALPSPPDPTWKVLFDSAVAEIAGNIVRHAHPPRTFRISLRGFADRVEAVMLDQGIPYQMVPAVGSADMRGSLDDPALDGGWGLIIARAVTDDIEYQRLDSGYNRWQIQKRLPA
jgi:hypothetical protein